ncbi:unnamed protein product [Musa hybrid cultivar]
MDAAYSKNRCSYFSRLLHQPFCPLPESSDKAPSRFRTSPLCIFCRRLQQNGTAPRIRRPPPFTPPPPVVPCYPSMVWLLMKPPPAAKYHLHRPFFPHPESSDKAPSRFRRATPCFLAPFYRFDLVGFALS